VADDNRLFLHACCAPCSAAILEWLRNEDIVPTLFFFNPNIYPFEEYEKRKKELQRYAQSLGIEFIDGDYDHSVWLKAVEGLEDQPERGLRCRTCFKMRLLATARMADENKFTRMSTTLASSRWKDLKQIAEAGHWAASQFSNLTFWDKNWRKDGLSERRRILLEENKFYNQDYCGCEFNCKRSIS
jgi:predicted adenine nucleotide alpha hydrolase (AANH) superfamily ATPase